MEPEQEWNWEWEQWVTIYIILYRDRNLTRFHLFSPIPVPGPSSVLCERAIRPWSGSLRNDQVGNYWPCQKGGPPLEMFVHHYPLFCPGPDPYPQKVRRGHVRDDWTRNMGNLGSSSKLRYLFEVIHFKSPKHIGLHECIVFIADQQNTSVRVFVGESEEGQQSVSMVSKRIRKKLSSTTHLQQKTHVHG